MNNTSFSNLPLGRPLVDNLDSLGYQQMTEIQAETLPLTLQGKDVLAQAKTGSGKTAAFGLAVLHQLRDITNQTQALVLCPTRELAEQVANEMRRLARPLANTKIITLCGGKPIGAQFDSLEHQPHIVVGTPGRVLKHLQKGSLRLDQLNTLVLDEADRMLDMGFQEEMIRIVRLLPAQRQTLLFSATYPDEIQRISQQIQQQAVVVQVESQHDSKNIKQIFYQIEKGERTSTLVSIMHQFKPAHSVVFCNRKHQCKELAEELWQQGFHAVALHGDLEQADRDRVLVQFANKSSSMLIATDVAARGLDIKDLDAVINFELSPDPQTHVHRIGRTGRAGNQGLALSLFMASEAPKLVAIEDYQKVPLRIDSCNTLKRREGFRLSPPMVTLCINAGKKNKLRAGDLLGALTADKSIPGKQIGKIDLFDTIAYVAVERAVAKQALKILSEGKIKGKKFRVRKLG